MPITYTGPFVASVEYTETSFTRSVATGSAEPGRFALVLTADQQGSGPDTVSVVVGGQSAARIARASRVDGGGHMTVDIWTVALPDGSGDQDYTVTFGRETFQSVVGVYIVRGAELPASGVTAINVSPSTGMALTAEADDAIIAITDQFFNNERIVSFGDQEANTTYQLSFYGTQGVHFADFVPMEAGDATLTATGGGSLTAVAAVVLSPAAGGGEDFPRDAEIIATSTATADRSVTRNRAASVAGASTAAAQAGVTRARAAAVGATSAVSASSAVTRSRVASMASVSSVAGQDSIERARSASIAAASAVTAARAVTVSRAGSVASASSITASAVVTSGLERSASIAASSEVTASRTLTLVRSASVVAESSVSAQGSTSSEITRSASVAVSSGVTANRTITRPRIAAVVSTSTIATDRRVLLSRRAGIVATSSLTATLPGDGQGQYSVAGLWRFNVVSGIVRQNTVAGVYSAPTVPGLWRRAL